jgi:hypothetical protein
MALNLVDIGRGWIEYAKGSGDTRALMESRLKVCDRCPNKELQGRLGRWLTGIVNKKGSLYRCGICKCPLSPLTANPGSACKDKRWFPAGDPRNP